jgi:TonB family protein
MSSQDGLRASVAIALVLLGGAMARAQVLLTEPGPLERQAKPITPENPIPKRVYFVMPTRPAAIELAAGRAVVTLRLTLDGAGSVAEIRSKFGGLVAVGNGLAASDAFIEATADAVKQWRYESPAEPPISFDVRIAFAPDGTASLVMHGGMALPPMAPPPPPPPLPDLPPAPWAEGAVRVGNGIHAPFKIRHVPPTYPPEAISARLQGVVILETRVDPDGHIRNARVLRSIPILDQAALSAVSQWEFTPTLLNGTGVPVLMIVTVQFSLP